MMTPEETMARLDEIAACAEEALDHISAAYVPDLVALVRHVLAERDEARSAAAKAGAREFALREEITTAFRRHGLVPGPEAIDGLVRERDAFVELFDPNGHNVIFAIAEAQQISAELQRMIRQHDEARAEADELRAVLSYEAAATVDASKRADPDLKLQHVAPDWSTIVLGTTPLHRFLSEARAVANRAAHERPLPNTNAPEDQHIPHSEMEDEP